MADERSPKEQRDGVLAQIEANIAYRRMALFNSLVSDDVFEDQMRLTNEYNLELEQIELHLRVYRALDPAGAEKYLEIERE